MYSQFAAVSNPRGFSSPVPDLSLYSCDLPNMEEKHTNSHAEDGAQVVPITASDAANTSHAEKKDILKAENPLYAQFASWTDDQRKQYERSFVRKVDWRLMPLLILMYLNNFLDCASLAQARLGTLEADLGESFCF